MRRFLLPMLLLALTSLSVACGDEGGGSGDGDNNAGNNAANNSTGSNNAENNGNNASNNASNNAVNNTSNNANNTANNAVNNTNNGTAGTDYPSVQHENGWVEYLPGGDTVCSRGTEYAFFVRAGLSDKVLIDFIGGGACWNDLTCSIAGSIFAEDVEGIRQNSTYMEGIYDKNNPENPFKDWTHIIVPYCTGDIHWGDAVQTYGEGDEAFEIRHKGAVNARAVMSWMYDNYADPGQIFVTGCSAGSYGSIGWSPHVMQRYPNAQIVQLGDSGAGIITESFFEDAFPRWNAFPLFPSWIDAINLDEVDYTTLQLPDMYSALGNYYSNHTFAQYNTILDDNQTFYFQAMGGGSAEEWSAQMVASIDAIHQTTPNFRSYTAPGEMHCILPYDELYTVESDGVRLIDWINGLVTQQPLPDVRCEECGP